MTQNILNSIEQELYRLLNNTYSKNTSNPISKISQLLFYKKNKPQLSRTKLLLEIIDGLSQEHTINIDNAFTTTYCLIIELLNIATKIHDSVLDHDNNKNNKYKLSTEQAILIGDLIFTLAFEKMLELDDQDVLEHFANTTQTMALKQANISEAVNPSKAEYQKLLKEKSWPLFNSIYYFFEITLINFDNKDTILNKILGQLKQFNTIDSSLSA